MAQCQVSCVSCILTSSTINSICKHFCSVPLQCTYTYGTIPTLNACTTRPVVGVVLQYQLATLAYTGGKPCALNSWSISLEGWQVAPCFKLVSEIYPIVVHEPLHSTVAWLGRHQSQSVALQTRHVEHV